MKRKNLKTPRVFIFSGPGGAGKTTIVLELFKNEKIKENCLRAVTVTTRARRAGEKDGLDYFFVSRDEFEYLKKRKFFLESQEVTGNCYGTPRMFLDIAKRQKKDLVLCIDVNGGMYLKNNLKTGRIVTIFIAAPEKELLKRMAGRADSEDTMHKRTKLSRREVSFSKKYDFIITNHEVSRAVEEAGRIILENPRPRPLRGSRNGGLNEKQ